MVALRNLLGGDDPSGQQKAQELLQEHPGRCLLQAAVEFAADLGSAVGTEVFKAVSSLIVLSHGTRPTCSARLRPSQALAPFFYFPLSLVVQHGHYGNCIRFLQDAPWLVERLHRLLVSCEAVPTASAVFEAVMICLAVAAPSCGPELLHQMQPVMEIVLRKAKTEIKVRTKMNRWLPLIVHVAPDTRRVFAFRI